MSRKYNEGVAASNRRRAKHGATARAKGTPVTNRTYRTWVQIKQRCNNPRAQHYHRYGGRGITMHPAWAADFSLFLEAVGDPPEPGVTLDRIDNNRGYEPGNVRWIGRKEQANNRENNIRITHEGETLTLSQWADKLGLTYKLLASRWKAGKRDPAVLLSLKRNARDTLATYNGQTKTLAKWAQDTGVPYETIYWRHKHGKDIL
jgi:hypothetical protein